jgi:hypothetical protein
LARLLLDWQQFDADNRATYFAGLLIAEYDSKLIEILNSDWNLPEVLIEDLFDLHSDTEHLRRVYVDISNVNFSSSDRLERFYGSRGYNISTERHLRRELRELRSGIYEPGEQPDLGQDTNCEIDVSGAIQDYACAELAGSAESAEHEEMLARGAIFATIDEYRISTFIGKRSVDIVLTLISMSNGEQITILPWDQWEREDNDLQSIPGEWVEVDAEAAEEASVWQMVAEAKELYDTENDQSIEKVIREVWGDDFDLPEVVDEVIDETDRWKEQLRAEYGDDETENEETEPESRPEPPEDISNLDSSSPVE